MGRINRMILLTYFILFASPVRFICCASHAARGLFFFDLLLLLGSHNDTLNNIIICITTAILPLMFKYSSTNDRTWAPVESDLMKEKILHFLLSFLFFVVVVLSRKQMTTTTTNHRPISVAATRLKMCRKLETIAAAKKNSS